MNHLHEFLESRWDAQPIVPGMRAFVDAQRRAKSAVCFWLGEAHEIPDIAAQIELMRLPFETCWLEMQLGEMFFCFLAEQAKCEGSLTLTLFIRFAKGEWEARTQTRITPGSETVETFSPVDFGDQAQASVRMLVNAVLRFLAALNCINVKRVEHPASKVKNAMRAQKGKRPLFSFWTLELTAKSPEAESLGGSHASPRLHLRRGHVRQYSPGRWCWVQPHLVGDKAAGVVHKDYSVSQQVYEAATD